MWISPICAHCQEGAVERWWVNISVLWMHRQASKMVWFLDTVQPVHGTVSWGSSEQKSFVMNVSQTINPDQKVPWYSISLPCLLLKPEEYQTTRFIFVQVNKQLALPRHAATIAMRYVCSMPPVLYIVKIGQIYYSLFAISPPCPLSAPVDSFRGIQWLINSIVFFQFPWLSDWYIREKRSAFGYSKL